MERGDPPSVWQMWRRLLLQVFRLIPLLLRQGLRAMRLAPSLAGVVLPSRLSRDWSAHKRCPSCGPGPSSPASSLALHAQGRTCPEAFREMWVRPYGTPLKVLLDQDGSFQGEMWEWLV